MNDTELDEVFGYLMLKAVFKDGVSDNWHTIIDRSKTAARTRVQRLVLEAKIEALKSLWNQTQPDIIPDGAAPLDMSIELHRRVESLQAELNQLKERE